MAAAVTLSPTFAVTGRRPLFTGSFVHGDTYREYDVAPDSTAPSVCNRPRSTIENVIPPSLRFAVKLFGASGRARRPRHCFPGSCHALIARTVTPSRPTNRLTPPQERP